MSQVLQTTNYLQVLVLEVVLGTQFVHGTIPSPFICRNKKNCQDQEHTGRNSTLLEHPKQILALLTHL